ncbi:hypothetical protein FOA22_05225 [Heyndrickxia oleronia]|uniref:hypothetical protein n=1 Tax=Heyndrickxia oleronia TaxID=38875 RepID=UPI00333CA760
MIKKKSELLERLNWDWDIYLCLIGILLLIFGVYSYKNANTVNGNVVLFVTFVACVFVLFDFISKLFGKTEGKIGNVLRIALPSVISIAVIGVNAFIGIDGLLGLKEEDLLKLNNIFTLFGLGLSIICMTSYLNKHELSEKKQSIANQIEDNEFYIFYANADRNGTGNLWHESSSGAYLYTFLTSYLSQKSIEQLIFHKVAGKLENTNILGIYYNDKNKNRTVVRIKLLDFSLFEKEVKFSFEKIEDTGILSSAIINKLGKIYSHQICGQKQLIVRVKQDINEFLREVRNSSVGTENINTSENILYTTDVSILNELFTTFSGLKMHNFFDFLSDTRTVYIEQVIEFQESIKLFLSPHNRLRNKNLEEAKVEFLTVFGEFLSFTTIFDSYNGITARFKPKSDDEEEKYLNIARKTYGKWGNFLDTVVREAPDYEMK